MIIQLHTPTGIKEIDSDTVTDTQLAELNLTRQWLNDYLANYPSKADATRAAEILATSPPAIPMPETWELLKIIGRRLGYIK